MNRHRRDWRNRNAPTVLGIMKYLDKELCDSGKKIHLSADGKMVCIHDMSIFMPGEPGGGDIMGAVRNA